MGGSGGNGGADGRAVFHLPHLGAFEPLVEKILIMREGADEIWSAGKGDHADAVVRALLDKFPHGIFHHLQAIGRLAVQREIQRLHGAGDIEREQDIDPAGLDLDRAFSETWAGKGDDEKCEREQAEEE